MSTLRDQVLTDAELLIKSIKRFDYGSAFDYASSVRDSLLKLLEDEMYKGNNND